MRDRFENCSPNQNDARRITVDVPIKVRYSETDQMGVVYHANYLIWFNIARDEIMNRLGLNVKQGEKLGYLFPVREISCKYLYPARYEDELIVRATAYLETVARLIVDYKIFLKKSKKIICVGRSVNILTDRNWNLLIRIPSEIKKLIANNFSTTLK